MGPARLAAPERSGWAQFDDVIRIAEYARRAGMQYINLVGRLCDRFALWDTGQGLLRR